MNRCEIVGAAALCAAAGLWIGGAAVAAASAETEGAVGIRCDYPGGNVKVLDIDERSGVVRLAPDLRDTQGHWFHFDFTVTGAAGRTLRFNFERDAKTTAVGASVGCDGGADFLPTLGPAVSRDGGRTWRWLRADGSRHEPTNAFDYRFASDETETRFAMSIPYSQKDWESFVSPYRTRSDVRFGTLCKARGGTRDVECLRLPCRGKSDWLFVLTARHHACETTGNPPMEGALAFSLGDSPEVAWLRAHADCVFVPFVDKDGVEDGDQGKNRAPHDHNRDYAKDRYPEVRALKDLIVRESEGRRIVFLDLHSPHVRSHPTNPEADQVFSFGAEDPAQSAHWNRFRAEWADAQRGGELVYDGKYDIPAGKGYYNVMKRNWAAGYLGSDPWVRTLTNTYLATCCEFGYSRCGGVNSVPGMRELGANMMKAAVRTARGRETNATDIVIYDGPTKAWTAKPLVFPGPWDLSSHGTISVELENTSVTEAVRLDADFSGNGEARCRMTMIPPGFKGTIDLDVCPPPANPEVAAQMKLMRTDPFMRGDREKPVDPRRIPAIRLGHHWTGASTAAKGAVPTVLVKRVVAKDTSSRAWPAWYRMSAKEFFPFVDRYGQFRYRTWPGKVASDGDLKTAAADERGDLAAHPGCGGWDDYGGWAAGPKRKATGRFYLEKIDGKWWFVDPLGNLWWSHGVVRVSASSAVTPLDGRENYFADLPKDDGTDPFGAFYHTFDELLKPYYDRRGWQRTYDFSAANLFRKYGDAWRTTYADLAHRRLRSWGLNTIANSSDRAIRLMNRTPWIERLETRGPRCPEQKNEGFWWHVPDPYHPEFRRNLRAQLESRRAELTSPWCVGIFVDNEHNWTGIREETVREYFKVIREEIKRLDPNLLYFGCRFAAASERVVRLCAEYADAVSYNIYRFRLDTLKLPAGVDRPILIGEFHFGSTSDTGLFNPSLVQVPDQTARAAAYVRYVTDAVRHPNLVGTHWHQFSDQPVTGRFDGENFNVGFTDVCDRPYRELVGAARRVGGSLYVERWGKSSPPPAVAQDVTLLDTCWMWGHETGQVDGANRKWGLAPATNYYSMAEGAESFGITSLNAIRWDLPDKAFRDTLRGMKRLTWPASAHPVEVHSTYAELGDWDFAVADEMPNVVGFELDDFFMAFKKDVVYAETPQGRVRVAPTVYPYADLLKLRRRCDAYTRPLELRLVCYDGLFGQCKGDLSLLKPFVDLVDVITYWTWEAKDTDKLEANFATMRRLAPTQRIQQGVYLYDFGSNREMDVALLARQLEFGLARWKAGEVDGFVFLCSSICNRDLAAVRFAREWLKRHGSETRPLRGELVAIRNRLRAHVFRMAAQNAVPFGRDGSLRVPLPARPGRYSGLWPDDWYFANAVVPEILTKEDAEKLFRFLTECVENAKTVPDRVEPNGHLVFQPGAESHPHGRRMPAHLPAAWIRLVKCLYGRTGDGMLKERWRGVLARSVAQLEVRDGLVWLSEDEPQVGFGFFDTVGLSGADLMSNVVLERGLRQAEELFGGELGATCRRMADGIRTNLGRLRTADGWYLSDTAGCRQFSPWSNGLLYGAPYLPDADRSRIRGKIVSERDACIWRGQTRHCPENWKRMNARTTTRPGHYMDGGYWSVGTAYALAALYDADPAGAVALLREMLAALEKSEFAEWENRAGDRFGARRFLMSAALPLAAIEAILTNQALLDWF